MKQAFLKAPYLVEVRDVQMPSLAEDEALIDVRACGICGSEENDLRSNAPSVL